MFVLHSPASICSSISSMSVPMLVGDPVHGVGDLVDDLFEESRDMLSTR